MMQINKLFVVGYIVVFAFLFQPFLFVWAYAASDVKEGYDENTEVSIKGKVTSISRGERGPLILSLVSSSKTYEVITAPPWYLDQEKISFFSGLELEVTGSKYFGDDGIIYVIGGRIKFLSTGKEISLRDADYRPLWGKGRWRDRLSR